MLFMVEAVVGSKKAIISSMESFERFTIDKWSR